MNLRFKILCLLLLCGFAAQAQFKGGADDGHAISAIAVAQQLGFNIFRGGTDDGINTATISAQPLGVSIFKGGADDGISSQINNAQPLGVSIFKGGADDGISISSITAQALGLSIFKGGTDDGITTFIAAARPLGLSFYKGGVDDGWAMALGSNLTLVPVTLVSYTAQWQNAHVLNSWQTSSEQNSNYFEIQRGIDGSNFTTIGQVAAAGNSNAVRNYSFTDQHVNSQYSKPPATLFYRLKMVDIDGQFQYSAIVVLNNTAEESASLYSLYPNPANQQFIIETKGRFKKYTLRMLNSQSQVLFQKMISADKDIIYTSAYPAGTYYVQVIDNENKSTQTFKILIVH